MLVFLLATVLSVPHRLEPLPTRIRYSSTLRRCGKYFAWDARERQTVLYVFTWEGAKNVQTSPRDLFVVEIHESVPVPFLQLHFNEKGEASSVGVVMSMGDFSDAPCLVDRVKKPR